MGSCPVTQYNVHRSVSSFMLFNIFLWFSIWNLCFFFLLLQGFPRRLIDFGAIRNKWFSFLIPPTLSGFSWARVSPFFFFFFEIIINPVADRLANLPYTLGFFFFNFLLFFNILNCLHAQHGQPWHQKSCALLSQPGTPVCLGFFCINNQSYHLSIAGIFSLVFAIYLIVCVCVCELTKTSDPMLNSSDDNRHPWRVPDQCLSVHPPAFSWMSSFTISLYHYRFSKGLLKCVFLCNLCSLFPLFNLLAF